LGHVSDVLSPHDHRSAQPVNEQNRTALARHHVMGVDAVDINEFGLSNAS